jgi:hypothetical protein
MKNQESINFYSIPVRNPDIVGRMADEEAVLVMPQKGQVKVLNEVGAEVWALIDGNRNVRNIVDHICSQFDVDNENAEVDILDFIIELHDREIVFIQSS